MEQFMQRSLKRTRTAEELYDLEDNAKRYKTDLITTPTPMIVTNFSSHLGSLPSPEETQLQSTTTAGAINNDFDHSLLKSFTISTKTKNTQYNQINELLNQVHVMRYGDPEARERWWLEEQEQQQQQQQQQQLVKQETFGMDGYGEEHMYESVNATLRHAFLERHQHHHHHHHHHH